jgi:hypothetical protein
LEPERMDYLEFIVRVTLHITGKKGTIGKKQENN